MYIMIDIITIQNTTTRINNSHCKVHNSAYPKYCQNMRHTSLY